ncbi:MAG: Lrp/AsnC family transcriptional regulator [Candidatus Lokiarchaeota archaeon]|nr:Lrp/AsnC family transcriptional regulator [Candidatus Lokiarchaeota archaeon]
MQNSKNLVEAQHFIKNLTGKTKFVISKNSRALGLSRQTYQYKLDNLRSEKIITNFTININPSILPINLKYVLLEIKTNPKEPELLEKLLKISQLKILDGILGEYSLFALFIFHSSEEYYQVLSAIDNIMAQSYFKKYHIIETIKVFKTNGIELYDNKIDPNFEIDSIDYVILKILQENQSLKPISTYEIKDIINDKYKDFLNEMNRQDISQSTIHNRIKKLEKKNVILNYALNFCPKKIGLKGKYLVRIKPKDPSKYNEIALNLEKSSYITDLFRIGEQHGLFAIVRVKNVEDYADFIKDLYQSDEVEDTLSSFVLDELKTYTNFVIH